MIKRSQLIQRLAIKNPNIKFEDINFIINESFDFIGSELQKGNRIEIRGFGSFELREKAVVSKIIKSGVKKRKFVHYKQSSVINN